MDWLSLSGSARATHLIRFPERRIVAEEQMMAFNKLIEEGFGEELGWSGIVIVRRSTILGKRKTTTPLSTFTNFPDEGGWKDSLTALQDPYILLERRAQMTYKIFDHDTFDSACRYARGHVHSDHYVNIVLKLSHQILRFMLQHQRMVVERKRA